MDGKMDEDRLNSILAVRDNETVLREKVIELLKENAELKARLTELEQERYPHFCRFVDIKLASFDKSPGSFIIDVNPRGDENMDDGNPATNDHVAYDKSVASVLGEEKVTSKDKPQGPRGTCFNCSEDHLISDCPHPRDHKLIAKNKREFLKNQPASAPRYHIDEMQKFSHLRPGLPSKKLREALGIRDNQLPCYIYRMRELGYPPAWLRDAEIQRSGVALYLSGREILNDADDEEGEVVEAGDKLVYDTTKLVEWPGFNCDPGSSFIDETDFYRCPPLTKGQSKEEMLGKLLPRSQKAYVKGEMQDTSIAKRFQCDDLDEEPVGKKQKVDDEKEAEIEPERDVNLDVKSISEGTPIVNTHSPYQSLPSQNKWAQGTTDHILFENLPDSTGKWEEMLKVLKKSRERRKTGSSEECSDNK